MKHAIRLLALIMILLSTTIPVALAQSTSGSITGSVADDSGAMIPGVTVTATNKGTGMVRTAVTSSNGDFTIPYLPPGGYEVMAELSGFRPTRVSNVTVNIGTAVSVKLVLKLGVEESVTVVADAPLIETTRSHVSSVVDEKLVEALPTNGRNFLDFALTTAGVVKDPRAGDLAFGGLRGTNNSLVIDGANNDNTFFGQSLGRTGSGRAPYQFSQDAVQEFQINTNSYSAEYGRAGGAVINVVTKSGTNELHGTGFYFLRDKDYAANDYINVINKRAKGPLHFDQYGGSVGGPIVRDKHFFFANVDAQRNESPNLVLFTLPASTPTDADTMAGIEKLRAKANSYTRNQDQDVYLLKTDHDILNSRLSFRYNRQKFVGENGETGGTTNAEEHSGDSLVNTDTFTANLTTPFGGSFFNEARIQYAKDEEPGRANTDVPEAVVRQSGQTILTIGRNNFSPRETTIKRWQIADAGTFLFANHTLKAGFDYSKDDVLNYFPGLFGGSYTFNSIGAFQRGRPSGSGELYRQAFAGPGTDGPVTNPDIEETALFVQDEWRMTSNLTLNVGVRYDQQAIAQPEIRNPDAQLAAAGIDTSLIPEDDDNIAPRVGFAWSPSTSGRTVVRGGYGIFYGRTPGLMIATATSNNGIQVINMEFRGESVPTYPNRFETIPTGGTVLKPSIFVFDKDFENPEVHQGNLGIEQAITNDLSIGLSYQYVKGDDLPRSADINLGTAEMITAPIRDGGSATYKRYTGAKPFTNFNRIIEFQSSGNSEYDGITLDVTKRFSRSWQARLAYTYAEARDDRPDATIVVIGVDDSRMVSDPLNPSSDWSWSDVDARHRVVLSGVWNLDYFDSSSALSRWLLNGWSISGIATYQSGLPYSATVNTDLNGDGNLANDLAPGFERNAFRFEDFVSIDPRITKRLPFGGVEVQLIAEAFNVTNESNVSAVRQTYYSLSSGQFVPQNSGATAFGIPTRSAGPRLMQLAAKITF